MPKTLNSTSRKIISKQNSEITENENSKFVNIAKFVHIQLHHPLKLNEFRVFDFGKKEYFQNIKNVEKQETILNSRIKILDELVKNNNFKFSISINGYVLEKIKEKSPFLFEKLKQLVSSKNVTLVSETYYKSVAGIKSPSEFKNQVIKNLELLSKEFDCKPEFFRGNNLSFESLKILKKLGFKALIMEHSKEGIFLNQGMKIIGAKKVSGKQNISIQNELNKINRTSHINESNQNSQKPVNFLKYIVLDVKDVNPYLLEDFNETNSIHEIIRNKPTKLILERKNNNESLKEDAIMKLFEIEEMIKKLNNRNLTEQFGLLTSQYHFDLMDFENYDEKMEFVGEHAEEYAEYHDQKDEKYNIANPYEVYSSFMNILEDLNLKIQNSTVLENKTVTENENFKNEKVNKLI